jgi:hypothetical protein
MLNEASAEVGNLLQTKTDAWTLGRAGEVTEGACRMISGFRKARALPKEMGGCPELIHLWDSACADFERRFGVTLHR